MSVDVPRALKFLVVGLGHQSIDDHIPAIKASHLTTLVGVVDVDPLKAKAVGEAEEVPYATDVASLLEDLKSFPDAALIAVPHEHYMPLIADLARRRIDIIKEKPFASSLENARQTCALVSDNGVTLRVTLQRRFNPIFRSFEQLVKRIGRVHSIESRYTMNVERLDEGWRASRLFAGGGALIDLGYHYIDLIIWYFGLPEAVTCHLSTGNRLNQNYDVEDTALLHFCYNLDDPGRQILGSLIVSRVYPDKDELLVAYGTEGSVAVRRGTVVRRDTVGNEIERLERKGSWPSALIDQLEEFVEDINRDRYRGNVDSTYLEQAALVEAAYRSARTNKAVDPRDVMCELREGGSLR